MPDLTVSAGRHRSAPRIHGSRARAGPCRNVPAKAQLQERDTTVTVEKNLQNPWVQPGYLNAWVSTLPEGQQAAVVAGVSVFGLILTWLIYEYLGPWATQNVPYLDSYMYKAPVIQGGFFALAGVAHFVAHQEFARFYPHRGAWGFWYLPGSPSFHVNWTGVAEILGGTGVVLGSLQAPFVPDWVLPASSFGLFLLTFVVSPSNMYMWTHNASPLTPEDTDKLGAPPVGFHIFRGFLQSVLLATYLGLAFHKY